MEWQKYYENRQKLKSALKNKWPATAGTPAPALPPPPPSGGSIPPPPPPPAAAGAATAGAPLPGSDEEHYVQEPGNCDVDIHLAAVRAARGVPPPPPPPPLPGRGSWKQDREDHEDDNAAPVVGTLHTKDGSSARDRALTSTFKDVQKRTESTGGRVVSVSLIRASGDREPVYDNLLLYPSLPTALRSPEEREVLEAELKDMEALGSSAAEGLKMAQKLAQYDELKFSHDKFLDGLTHMHRISVQLDTIGRRWHTVNDIKQMHSAWVMPPITFERSKTLVADGSLGHRELSGTFPTGEYESFAHSTVAPLSADAWTRIGEFLPPNDLLSLPLVSLFHFSHRETLVWATLYRKCFGSPTEAIEDDQYRQRYVKVFDSLGGDILANHPPSLDQYIDKFVLDSKGTFPMVFDPTLEVEEKKAKKHRKTRQEADLTSEEKAKEEKRKVKAEERAKTLARLAPKLLLTGCAPIAGMEPVARGNDFYKLETIEIKDPDHETDNMLLALLTHEKGGEATRRFMRRMQWQDAWNINKAANASRKD